MSNDKGGTVELRWGEIPPWMEEHGDWCDDDVPDNEYADHAYPLYRVKPPPKPQFVSDETAGWVWAENKRAAYEQIGPQRTFWGTLIQAPQSGQTS